MYETDHRKRSYSPENFVPLNSAPPSAGFPALLKHMFIVDAYHTHGKIHSVALMYAGSSFDEDFVRKCEINKLI